MNESQIILIVEDSDDDFFATMRAFKTVSLVNSVRRCTSGDQALDYLLQRGEFSTPGTASRPGIILLDLNLPGTDGQELLRTIKANQDLLKIPVIVLTTSGTQKEIEQCYAAGANSYIQKPLDLTGFIHEITRLCEDWLKVSISPKNIRQETFVRATE